MKSNRWGCKCNGGRVKNINMETQAIKYFVFKGNLNNEIFFKQSIYV